MIGQNNEEQTTVNSIIDFFSDLVNRYDKMVWISYNYNSVFIQNQFNLTGKDILIICNSDESNDILQISKKIIKLPNDIKLHSKVYLFFNEKECDVIIGTFNLTRGIMNSIEYFNVEHGKFNTSIEIKSFNSVKEFSNITNNPIIDQILDYISNIVKNKNKLNNTPTTLSDKTLSVFHNNKKCFVSTLGQNSLRQSLISQLSKLHGNNEIIIWYISPYHNKVSFFVFKELIEASGINPKDISLKIITNGVEFIDNRYSSANYLDDFISYRKYFKSVEFRF